MVDTIHIAYALNEKYAEMTCVSMCSVLANCDDSTIVFHLFAEQLSEEHTKKISDLCVGWESISICYHDIKIDGELFVTAEHKGFATPSLTKETYARMLIPELLPDLERLLYLDCDTIVEGNIAQLWEIDLGDALAGMVPDYSLGSKKEKKQIIGLAESSIYFNGGVILMNLSGLRKFPLRRIATENVVDLYRKITDAGLDWCADQEVLNYALSGRIKKLPMKFNSYFWMSLPLGVSIGECVEALLNPAIVHFVATPKPTELGYMPVNVPEWGRYYKYKAMSPFADDNDAVRIAIFKSRESNTLNALLPPFYNDMIHWFSFHFANQLFSLAAERYIATANGKEIVIWGLNERVWLLTVFLVAQELDVIGIVDGLSENHGIAVFDYIVDSPDILRNRVGETFVMLDMRNHDIALKVMEELKSWGYTEKDYCYVYAPIWEGTKI